MNEYSLEGRGVRGCQHATTRCVADPAPDPSITRNIEAPQHLTIIPTLHFRIYSRGYTAESALGYECVRLCARKV
jgi:hypothetical protein